MRESPTSASIDCAWTFPKPAVQSMVYVSDVVVEVVGMDVEGLAEGESSTTGVASTVVIKVGALVGLSAVGIRDASKSMIHGHNLSLSNSFSAPLLASQMFVVGASLSSLFEK